MWPNKFWAIRQEINIAGTKPENRPKATYLGYMMQRCQGERRFAYTSPTNQGNYGMTIVQQRLCQFTFKCRPVNVSNRRRGQVSKGFSLHIQSPDGLRFTRR